MLTVEKSYPDLASDVQCGTRMSHFHILQYNSVE